MIRTRRRQFERRPQRALRLLEPLRVVGLPPVLDQVLHHAEAQQLHAGPKTFPIRLDAKDPFDDGNRLGTPVEREERVCIPEKGRQIGVARANRRREVRCGRLVVLVGELDIAEARLRRVEVRRLLEDVAELPGGGAKIACLQLQPRRAVARGDGRGHPQSRRNHGLLKPGILRGCRGRHDRGRAFRACGHGRRHHERARERAIPARHSDTPEAPRRKCSASRFGTSASMEIVVEPSSCLTIVPCCTGQRANPDPPRRTDRT